MLDAQVRDRLMMGAVSKDDSVEKTKSDNSDVLSHFDDEKIRRNTSRNVKALDEVSSCKCVIAF